ncbi:MAG TPA: glucokinase [Burkholderiaceae bacterium]|nr:glucokinase [Burkholderiaceae bacterium]
MTGDDHIDLVADIGGTNARFARFGRDGLLDVPMSLRVAGFGSLEEAVEHYLSAQPGPRPQRAALAVATAVTGDRVKLTNAAWEFSTAAAARTLGLERLKVLNDFTALAWGLPLLQPADWVQVGPGEPQPEAALALIGPGTGLGVSGLVPSAGGPASSAGGLVPIEGEGGHASLAPADAREMAIVEQVWREFPHVSIERLVSGTGLPVLLRAVAAVDRLPMPGAWLRDASDGGTSEVPAPTPAQICDAAVIDREPLCVATLNTFCAMLGGAAANLALTLGARGGLYIAGGIVPRIMPFFERSPFRQRFEAKGRFGRYLSCIPTRVIVAPNLALAGAARSLTA